MRSEDTIFPFLLLCALVLISVPATAQNQAASVEPSPSGDTCLQDSQCTELYASARSQSQAGQYEAALVSYQAAYARSRAFWLLVNIGRMQQKAGRPEEAMTTYGRLLEDPEAQQDAETQSKAREYLRQAELEVQVQRVPLVPAAASANSRPVYKKWWFWTAVGTAMAGAAVGLAVGLTPRSPSVPLGVSVYDPRF